MSSQKEESKISAQGKYYDEKYNKNITNSDDATHQENKEFLFRKKIQDIQELTSKNKDSANQTKIMEMLHNEMLELNRKVTNVIETQEKSIAQGEELKQATDDIILNVKEVSYGMTEGFKKTLAGLDVLANYGKGATQYCLRPNSARDLMECLKMIFYIMCQTLLFVLRLYGTLCIWIVSFTGGTITFIPFIGNFLAPIVKTIVTIILYWITMHMVTITTSGTIDGRMVTKQMVNLLFYSITNICRYAHNSGFKLSKIREDLYFIFDETPVVQWSGVAENYFKTQIDNLLTQARVYTTEEMSQIANSMIDNANDKIGIEFNKLIEQIQQWIGFGQNNPFMKLFGKGGEKRNKTRANKNKHKTTNRGGEKIDNINVLDYDLFINVLKLSSLTIFDLLHTLIIVTSVYISTTDANRQQMNDYFASKQLVFNNMDPSIKTIKKMYELTDGLLPQYNAQPISTNTNSLVLFMLLNQNNNRAITGGKSKRYNDKYKKSKSHRHKKSSTRSKNKSRSKNESKYK
jgi:hypothetical protein